MAFTKSTVATNNISNLPNKPLITATALKQKFDDYGAADKTYVNGLIDELEATTGTSGAENIGSKTISGLAGNTIWTQLSSIATQLLNNFLSKTNTAAYTPSAQYHPATKKYVDDSVAGAIVGNLPTGSVTAVYLATDAVETDKIKNDAVTQDKIADNAVGSAQIASGSVDYAELSSGIQGRFAMTDKAIAELLMLADIDSKVFSPNLGKFYTNFSTVMDYSLGVVDTTKQGYTGALSAGATGVTLPSASGFAAGQEISIQDPTNYEDVIISSVVSTTVNFKTPLVNSYTNPAIYRSLNNGTAFGLVGTGMLPSGSAFGLHFDSNMADFVGTLSPESDTGTYDTTNKVFGTASKLYNGSQITTYADSSIFDVSSSNFYYDLRFKRANSTISEYVLFGQNDSTNTQASRSVRLRIVSTTSQLSFAANVGSTNYEVLSSGGYSDTNWHHVRCGRDGSNLRLFVDGVLVGSTAITGTINNSSNKFSIAQAGEEATARWVGNIDEFLLVKGVSPGSTSFTVPTLPYGSGAPVTKNVIRMNITPYEDVKYISAWLTKTNLAGFTADGKLSIVDASADESYVDLTESITDLGATQEVMMIGNAATADSKVTLKLELNRASTSDSVSFTKLIGGVSA